MISTFRFTPRQRHPPINQNKTSRSRKEEETHSEPQV